MSLRPPPRREEPVLTFALRIDRVTRFMLCAICTFVSLHVFSCVLDYGFGYERQGGFRWLTSLDMEQNPQTWYQTTSLFVCSVLLLSIAHVERRRQTPRWRYWLSVAGLFCFLSMDEMGALHERMSEPLRRLIGGDGVLRFAWILGWAVGLLVIAATHLRWLIALPRATRASFIIAGTLFVGGAIGFEMVESALYTRLETTHHLGYELSVILEEVLEMLGITVFVRALLHHLSVDVHEVRLRLTTAAPAIEASAHESVLPSGAPPAPAEKSVA